ncbi:MAG TPA: acetolactate synthase large subunit [Candidatus Mediterraneibacter stercorigallinarum]|uniref:Acetolactate synthase large subunit n=1 Tax=Candidatus Mediterraneibacter stercorigallinarum TaxID=2838686 RepID=A0A9D2D9N6_9FIRM|nr:acetolactate synthase large subunit [Candidatus Mediterraneibacter stercorigallinarum]
MQITGADLFVKALQEEDVDTLFAYPGGQAIDLFNALYGVKGIDIVLPRHEQGLVHAADGYARAAGKTGVCLVTSGPGATNLVTGIATANYDSVPLVCFTGQVSTNLIGNDAFQEVDIVGITRSITKWAVTVRKQEDLAGIIKKAFYIANSGKPGVVVVDIPKDIQQAKKPLFLLGGGVNIAHADQEMTMLAEKTQVPVITTIMGKGAVPTDHPLYVGNLGIHGSFAANRAVSECDVLFSIGVRFNDRITGKVSEFAPHVKIIHVDIEPASISRNITVDIPIVADAKKAVRALLEKCTPLDTENWRLEIQEWKQKYPLEQQQETEDGVTPYSIIHEINTLFHDAVITTDVGQNQLWTTQFLELNGQTRLLTSGGLGTMGYGLPAAIGAKLGCPDKTVVAVCGDGGMQMNIQEIATAVVYELPVIICVMNNGYLGNVRQWQEMFYNRRYSSTCLRWRKSCPPFCSMPSDNCPEYTPDFVKLAESYGAKGIRVKKKEEIRPALEEAAKSKTVPILVEFIIDREENVLPIVPPGNPLEDMIMGGTENA